jgi:hypothetical protein
MANQDQIDAMMRNFPPEAELLQMPPEDMGMHLLKYMTRAYAATNRFNFLQMVSGGHVQFRFMEAWSWLAREGFLAHARAIRGRNRAISSSVASAPSAAKKSRASCSRSSSSP